MKSQTEASSRVVPCQAVPVRGSFPCVFCGSLFPCRFFYRVVRVGSQISFFFGVSTVSGVSGVSVVCPCPTCPSDPWGACRSDPREKFPLDPCLYVPSLHISPPARTCPDMGGICAELVSRDFVLHVGRVACRPCRPKNRVGRVGPKCGSTVSVTSCRHGARFDFFSVSTGLRVMSVAVLTWRRYGSCRDGATLLRFP